MSLRIAKNRTATTPERAPKPYPTPPPTATPQRLKCARFKKTPASAGIYIGAGTKWANPYQSPTHGTPAHIQRLYADYIAGELCSGRLDISELTGQDITCTCRRGAPCHGDVLLFIANPHLPPPW